MWLEAQTSYSSSTSATFKQTHRLDCVWAVIGPRPTLICINLAGTCFLLALSVSEASSPAQRVGEDIESLQPLDGQRPVNLLHQQLFFPNHSPLSPLCESLPAAHSSALLFSRPSALQPNVHLSSLQLHLLVVCETQTCRPKWVNHGVYYTSRPACRPGYNRAELGQHTSFRELQLTTINVHSQELLQWINSLLQLNLTKVEQCGTGLVCDAPPSAVRPAPDHEQGAPFC